MFERAPESTPSRWILIVEDDDDIRETLKEILEEEGYAIGTARNGMEGLVLLNSMPRPALVLLDLMMPVMHGWAFLEGLAELDDHASIPVVVVTAHINSAATIKRAVMFLQKPIEHDALLSVVQHYCGALGAAP